MEHPRIFSNWNYSTLELFWNFVSNIRKTLKTQMAIYAGNTAKIKYNMRLCYQMKNSKKFQDMLCLKVIFDSTGAYRFTIATCLVYVLLFVIELLIWLTRSILWCLSFIHFCVIPVMHQSVQKEERKLSHFTEWVLLDQYVHLLRE